MMKAAPWPVTALFVLSLALNLWFAGMPDWRWIPAAVAAWYIADLLSGLTHMYMDYRPCTPGIGLDRMFHYSGSRESAEYLALRAEVLPRISPFERLVYDFKNHHPRPEALGRRPFLVQIGSTIIFAALPFSILLNILAFTVGVPGWLMAGLVVLTIGGTCAQYFHGTLHRPDNPWTVRAMRRAGLLMTPQAHALHHETLRRDFATNTGWSNPLVNAIFRTAMHRGWFDEAGLEPR
ncbi:MAG TPA: fatty acid desaturase CarF family protein [Sphingomicrobium sp.]|nr:fatty acid desaturase CarF family protein [Sphingomicrobium sp.]